MTTPTLTLQRGQTGGFLINMGFNITGGSWEILENGLKTDGTVSNAPSFTITDAVAGLSTMRWSPAVTDNFKPGVYIFRCRINLPADEAIPLTFRLRVL